CGSVLSGCGMLNQWFGVVAQLAMQQMGERVCLRCKTVPLRIVEPTYPQVTFFECPSCRRPYALRPGKELTFRWLHPISLALYEAQFEEAPSIHAGERAVSSVKERRMEELELLVNEVRLELQEPTQQVRDILDCRASESDLREFLRLFGEHVSEYLARRSQK